MLSTYSLVSFQFEGKRLLSGMEIIIVIFLKAKYGTYLKTDAHLFNNISF
jgi:hypothetical protein